MDKMERGMLELLKRGPVEAEGRLECAFVEKLKLDKSASTYEAIRGKLFKFEDKGTAIIERSGNVLRVARLAPEARQVLPNFRTDEDEPEVDESISAILEASEIEVQNEPAGGESAMNEPLAIEKEPIWVQVTFALLALQTAASKSKDGIVTGSSAQVIAAELGIPLSRANILNAMLGKLGLRQTSGSRNSWVHRIDMVTKEVTEEMVQSPIRPLRRSEDKAASVEDVSAPQIDETVESVVAATEAVATPVTQSQSLIERMAAALEIQHKKIQGLQADKLTLEKRIENQRQELVQKDTQFEVAAETSAKVIMRLTADLTAATDKIAELTAAPSERVNELLALYLEPESDTPL